MLAPQRRDHAVEVGLPDVVRRRRQDVVPDRFAVGAGAMSVSYSWRGEFENVEVGALQAGLQTPRSSTAIPGTGGRGSGDVGGGSVRGVLGGDAVGGPVGTTP